MNARPFLPLPAIAAGVCALSSCSNLQSTATKMGEFSRDSVAKVGGIFSNRPPVVEVKEDSLQDLPLGHERALAYQEKKRNSWWFFSGPVDFVEPDLPDSDADMPALLLPPRAE